MSSCPLAAVTRSWPRIYPSAASTSRMRSRILEAGERTVDLPRICALRMRVSMSAIGSFMISPPLPARLHHAGQLPGGAQIAQRDPADLELAVIGVRPPGELAAVVQPRCRAVARQFRQPQRRAKALFHRLAVVLDHRLERRALLGVAIHELLALLLALDHCFLGHDCNPPRLSC